MTFRLFDQCRSWSTTTNRARYPWRGAPGLFLSEVHRGRKISAADFLVELYAATTERCDVSKDTKVVHLGREKWMVWSAKLDTAPVCMTTVANVFLRDADFCMEISVAKQSTSIQQKNDVSTSCQHSLRFRFHSKI